MHGEKSSAIDVIPRTAKFGDHCEITKSLVRDSGRFRRYGKPIEPSEDFQSCFASIRLRSNVFCQDEKTWNDEDKAFVLSGETTEEPDARLGGEFVAKSLLVVSITTPLTPSGLI